MNGNMIWHRLRLDRVWMVIPVLAAMLSLAWWLAGYSGDPLAVKVMVGALSGAIPIPWTFLPPFRQRYTLLDMTLPITGRQLFASRVLFMLAFVWLPLLTALAVQLAVRGNRVWSECLPLFEGGAMLTVGLMLIQTFRVREIIPPTWLTLGVAAGIFISMPWLAKHAFPGSPAIVVAALGGCALASAALFLKAWAEVPKAFQLAHAEPEASAAQPQRIGNANPTTPWWPVCRELYFAPARLRWSIFLALFIGFFTYRTLGPICAVFGVGLLGYPTELRWLLPLPISPRKLFWLASFGNASAILVGLLIATLVSTASSNQAAVKTSYERSEDGMFGDAKKSGTLNVPVPNGYWNWARGGSAPMIEAPLGESHPQEMQKWLGLLFYNPYSVDRTASQQYLEWQFLRATEAVYGKPVQLSDAEVLPRLKTLKRQPKMQAITLAFAAFFLLAQMCVVYLAWGKRFLPYARTGFKYFVAMTPFLLGFGLILVSPPVGNSGIFFSDALMLNLARILPDSLWMLALIAAGPIAGLYLLAEKLWRGMDFRQMGPQMEATLLRRQQGRRLVF